MKSCPCWPLIPPAALMSATYISSVFFSGSPRNDAGPLTDNTEPIFTSAWAVVAANTRAATAANTFVIAPSLAVQSLRRFDGDLALAINWYNDILVWSRAKAASADRNSAPATRSATRPQGRGRMHSEEAMERSFRQEVKSLRLGAGDTFHGEAILAVTKA